MYIPGGYIIGSDFRSGYHCLYMHEDDKKYLAFALGQEEVSPEEWARLHKHQ